MAPTFLLFLCLCSTIYGNTLVWLRLDKIEVLENTLLDGSYCFTDEGPCNMVLVGEVDKPRGLDTNSLAKYKFSTAESKETVQVFGDSFTMDDENGAADLDNPFPPPEQRTIETGIEEIVIKVYITHKDPPQLKPMSYSEYTSPFTGWGETTFVIETSGEKARVTFTINVECAPDYYPRLLSDITDTEPANCTHCVETDNYTCSGTGSKICKEGFYGDNCDKVPCAPDTTKTHQSYSPVQTEYTQAEEVVVTCGAGYAPTTSTLTCASAAGAWSAVWPECSVLCVVPATAAVLTPASYLEDVKSGGYRLTLTCQGAETVLVCGAEGAWSGDPPQCDVREWDTTKMLITGLAILGGIGAITGIYFLVLNMKVAINKLGTGKRSIKVQPDPEINSIRPHLKNMPRDEIEDF